MGSACSKSGATDVATPMTPAKPEDQNAPQQPAVASEPELSAENSADQQQEEQKKEEEEEVVVAEKEPEQVNEEKPSEPEPESEQKDEENAVADATTENEQKPTKPLKICIAGPPASGKGTQCELIRDAFGVLHLSTGDMLRAQVKAETELGMKAKEYMDNGQLVPDELIISIMEERMQQDDVAQHGWLLDGFPRTGEQAKFMVAKGIVPDIFLTINCPDEVVISRIAGRRTDPETGTVYHLEFNPPPEDIVDRLIQRSDDTEEKIKVRLEFYHENLDGILKQFESDILRVDGNQDKELVWEAIRANLDSVQAK